MTRTSTRPSQPGSGTSSIGPARASSRSKAMKHEVESRVAVAADIWPEPTAMSSCPRRKPDTNVRVATLASLPDATVFQLAPCDSRYPPPAISAGGPQLPSFGNCGVRGTTLARHTDSIASTTQALRISLPSPVTTDMHILSTPTVRDLFVRSLERTHWGATTAKKAAPLGAGHDSPARRPPVAAGVLGRVGKTSEPPGGGRVLTKTLITTQCVLRPFATPPPACKQGNVRQGIGVSAPSAPRLRTTPGSLTIPETRFQLGQTWPVGRLFRRENHCHTCMTSMTKYLVQSPNSPT